MASFSVYIVPPGDAFACLLRRTGRGAAGDRTPTSCVVLLVKCQWHSPEASVFDEEAENHEEFQTTRPRRHDYGEWWRASLKHGTGRSARSLVSLAAV